MSFFWQGRFEESPSDLLKHYYADALRQPIFLEALHAWDKAQIVILAEQKLAPLDSIECLVKSLDAMEKEGVVSARSKEWNVIHGGEEYMRRTCGEERSGWLHVGRSSASIRSVASRVAFRKLLQEVMASTIELRSSLMEAAREHIETVMPGYSYIQQTEPCTLGFYLMSWVGPLERDFRRCLNAYRNTNISSVGTGGGFGIEFNIDLERLDELLGFDAAPSNARDAVRNYDYLIETYTVLALLHNTIGRMAMDLLIWHSAEFSAIQLPDRLCITSSISPQKKIPYVLEFIHGTSGLITGRLVEALAINKTASDQLEGATMLPAEFWFCAQESRYAISALCDAIQGMKVNKERMSQLANDHWAQASSLIAYLVKEEGMSYRTGHQILCKLMQRVMDKGVKPSDVSVEWVEQAALDYTGKKLGLTQITVDRILDAANCIREKKYRGGTSTERVVDHIREAGKELSADKATMLSLSDRVLSSQHKLESAFAAVRHAVLQG
ncbi:MAG: hypothetical protein HY322_09175 [Betaproteobacteria bacterium]|nr:hypothetical protein [Betaproteobacteria bacterium]